MPSRGRQLYAAVCANGHVLTDSMPHPETPGTGHVPKLCKRCSAPVFTACTNEGCEAPIHGDIESNVVVVSSRGFRADWFCQQCQRPYLWAEAPQVRTWIENRLRFDGDIDEDRRLELIEALASLAPEKEKKDVEESGRVARRFRDLLAERAPGLYEEAKHWIPILAGLISKAG